MFRGEEWKKDTCQPRPSKICFQKAKLVWKWWNHCEFLHSWTKWRCTVDTEATTFSSSTTDREDNVKGRQPPSRRDRELCTGPRKPNHPWDFILSKFVINRSTRGSTQMAEAPVSSNHANTDVNRSKWCLTPQPVLLHLKCENTRPSQLPVRMDWLNNLISPYSATLCLSCCVAIRLKASLPVTSTNCTVDTRAKIWSDSHLTFIHRVTMCKWKKRFKEEETPLTCYPQLLFFTFHYSCWLFANLSRKSSLRNMSFEDVYCSFMTSGCLFYFPQQVIGFHFKPFRINYSWNCSNVLLWAQS